MNDAELKIMEVALEIPTRDFSSEPAMDDADCSEAIAFGMSSPEVGVDVLCLGEMGIGNTTASAAADAVVLPIPISPKHSTSTPTSGLDIPKAIASEQSASSMAGSDEKSLVGISNATSIIFNSASFTLQSFAR